LYNIFAKIMILLKYLKI